MNLSKMNKYLLNHIFSFLDFKKELNLIKYNNGLKKKLDITIYTYQKTYFASIINPAILQNSCVLLNNNLFDKKTLNKLMSDWKNETTEMFDGNDFFTKITDLKIFENLKKIKKSPKTKLPNLIELNISNQNNFELPCIILSNLEILSLKNMYGIKFLSNNYSNITLDKLKKLYIDNISFNQNTNLKIKVDNLKYLDLRFNQVEDEEDNDDDNDNEDDEDDDEVPKKKFSPKEGFIKTNLLEQLINIFDFNFLSLFQINQEILENEDEEEPEAKFEDIQTTFKKPEEFFKENIIKKLDYLNLEILYSLSVYSGACEETQEFINTYLFSKTKGNKYIFKTIFKNSKLLSDTWEIEFTEKELRLCNDINYNNYYYSNRDLEVWGYGFDNSIKEQMNYENSNTFKIFDKKDYPIETDFLILLDYFKPKNTTLKVIDINSLEVKDANNFINNIKKFLGLNSLCINNCVMENGQLIKLFTNLSKLKLLFSIQINFESALKLNKQEKEKICKLFPDISFEKNKKSSSIKWINHNIRLK